MHLAAVIFTLAIMCALALSFFAGSVLSFSYGSLPWSAKQYKTIGTLYAVSTALLAVLFTIYYALTGKMDIWYALPILPVFAMLAWIDLRKAKALQNKNGC